MCNFLCWLKFFSIQSPAVSSSSHTMPSHLPSLQSSNVVEHGVLLECPLTAADSGIAPTLSYWIIGWVHLSMCDCPSVCLSVCVIVCLSVCVIVCLSVTVISSFSRLYLTLDKEFYVCYHDNPSQVCTEMMFKLLFGSSLWQHQQEDIIISTAQPQSAHHSKIFFTSL